MSSSLFWATNRRSFSLQGTAYGLRSNVSSITEMILSACTACGARHFGHDAICSADGLEPASATTFARVPHLQRHNATILVMTASSASGRLRRGLYARDTD